MINWIVIRRLAGLASLVCAPLCLLFWAELVAKWDQYKSNGELAEEVSLRLVAVLMTAVFSLWGGWLWQRRLDRQVEVLLDACRKLALGEPVELPDPPVRLDELGRLGLAIQVLREALVDYLSVEVDI